MYKTITFLLLLIIVSAVHLNAQTLEGRIIDQDTREPLEGATVVESGTSNGTITAADGSFSLQLTSGTNEVTIRYLGYRTIQVPFSDAGGLLEIEMAPQTLMSGEVFVNSLRVDDSTPIAYSNVSREEIESRNMGQDIPFLVSTSPSVVTTSDAGAGIGYTGIRVRGVDPGRINVTINGIPLNDSESHGVFWVNLPDLASSTQNIQIQRGVGTSTQGAGAFGATMNLQTAIMNADPYGELNTGFGSYGTKKYNVQLGSGILDSGWQFEGRLSKIESDGYIDRASSDLKSFYLSASHHGENSLLKADVFSGQEVTYQAWNGVPEPVLHNDADDLERYITGLWLDGGSAEHLRSNLGNRRFNEYTYSNQVDHYQQDHYQLHYSHQVRDNWAANASIHYTYGRGYYEQFRTDDALNTYGIDPVEIGNETITSSDLVRRRWLDNHFYGAVFSTQFDHENKWRFTLGGGYNEYDGDHFGEVIWARFAGESDLGDHYYDNNGFKRDFNVYGKLNYFFSPDLNAYADLQFRDVGYEFLGKRIDEQTEEINDVTQIDRIYFLNPKVGLVYRFAGDQRLFASFSAGGKEPTRRDYVESTVENRPAPERLYDYEFGYSANFKRLELGANLYYMKYRDQLILTGAINDVGAYVRQNVPDSYRAGIELQGAFRFTPDFLWNGNVTFSRNKISSYTRFLDDYDEGGQQEQQFSAVDIAFSPGITASSVLTYRFGGLTSEWISSFVSRQYLDNTQTVSRSVDPYWVNDLRVHFEFNPPLVTAVTTSLQVNNLLNEKYVSNGYTFGFIAGGEQHFNYYYPQAERNVLVNVKVKF